MAQLMPLPLTVSCSSKIQIGFTFLVLAYPDCPGKEAVKWLYGDFTTSGYISHYQDYFQYGICIYDGSRLVLYFYNLFWNSFFFYKM